MASPKFAKHLTSHQIRGELKKDIDPVPQCVQLSVSSGSGGGGGAIPAVMSHRDDVLAQVGPGRSLWKLRFWTRGLDDKLVAEIKKLLTAHGFPLAKLQDPAGAADVIAWLAIPKNRKSAVKAYDDAIAALKPSWAHEAKSGGLANLLSLAMFSGPDFDVDEVSCKRRHRSIPHHWYGWWHDDACAGKGGWLGTGDAPLGEGLVWADFPSSLHQRVTKREHRSSSPPWRRSQWWAGVLQSWAE